MPRSIVHLDADAFFASVEQSADARLRGKPVAVGGEKRGIIASASYEARKMGIYTPMPTVRARQLCPKLIVLPGDYDRYEQFSRWMFAYAFDFTPEVEITGIDEGYFDLSGTRLNPRDIAQTIRKAISQRLHITVSEGIASNKLISQIASKLQKPSAFVEVPPGQETAFLHPLPNHWLPGIGPKTSARLDAAGLVQIHQIARTPPEMLELLLGNQAARVWEFANGIDERPLQITREAPKSFGQQETFMADVTDEDYLEAVLRRMADQLMAKVRAEGKSIRTVQVKVRYNDMSEDQRVESLTEPTDLETDLYSRLRPLLQQAWKRRVSLRLVSLRFSNLYDSYRQGELALDDRPDLSQPRRTLARVVDALRQEHGNDVVMRSHDLRLREGPHDAAVAVGPVRPIRSYLQLAKRKTMVASVPLNVRSYYSFLDSTLPPEALIALAVRYELPALALTDSGSLHGAAVFAAKAAAAGIKPLIGAELLIGNSRLLCYVQNAHGYHNLCRILTREGGAENAADSIAALHRLPFPRRSLEGRTGGLLAVSNDPGLAPLFPGRFYFAAARAGAEVPAGLPGVLCPRVHYGTPADRQKWNILQSIRTGTLLQQEHPDKRLDGAFHFRSPAEMNRLAREEDHLLAHTMELAGRCDFTFPFGPPQFPVWHPPDGSTCREFLENLVMTGLRHRYGERANRHEAQALEELDIIAEVGYEDYFLITWDLLQECARNGIPWITRGSAADSLVCYCLGISGVCPIRFELYFQRFLNKDRMALNKLPDIDIDFPHDRKDDVIDLLFAKYGPDHCAVVGGFSTYQVRGAVGDVAKVLGLSEYQTRRFTERLPGGYGGSWKPDATSAEPANSLLKRLQSRPETVDMPLLEEPYRTALTMAEFLSDFPRYPKMHPCGVVLSRQPLHELTPCFISRKHYPTTHFDMDAVEGLGLVKMDILAQGGLAVMRDACASLAARGIVADLEALEPWEDPEVWAMIADGHARAVHHIESPAMVNLCGMTNVREIDGLIAIVSVIRPGAANEDKKLRFTRRYQGLEPTVYPHPSLEFCLRSTHGLVVYEEHILQICVDFARMAPGRADVLRRALVKQKFQEIAKIGVEFIECARAAGHDDDSIGRVWELVTGFNGYAFNKAHSTAYGVEAYQAAWLKRYHPADFMAAVLTNGKGFYTPLVYVLECHRLGIRLLPPCLKTPGPGFQVKGDKIQVPVSAIKGLTGRLLESVLEAHRCGPEFTSLSDFAERLQPTHEELESLIRAGACDGWGQSRTRLFWEAQVCRRRQHDAGTSQGWLLEPPPLTQIGAGLLQEPEMLTRLRAEEELFSYPVSGHPLDLYPDIAWDTYCPVVRLREYIGQEVVLCGLVVVTRLHNQEGGAAMKFLTLADRTGLVETELFAEIYRLYGLATVRYPVLEVFATVEPFENKRGFSLRVHRAGKPRKVRD